MVPRQVLCPEPLTLTMTSAPRRFDHSVIDLQDLGVPMCQNMEVYTMARTGCFYDHNEQGDLKEELRVSSRRLFNEWPPRVLMERSAWGDPEAQLEMALRYVAAGSHCRPTSRT